MDSIKFQKPFLKWVGGKTQIIHNVMEKFPTEMENYHEIFLGGGSVLLGLLTLQKQGKITINGSIYAYDINTPLINLYKHVQQNKDSLFNFVDKYVKEYGSLTGTEVNRKPANIVEAKTSKESYYYWIRKLWNSQEDKTTIESAAIFLFLNKTCFRGMYREGPNGFNVPYGHYKTTPKVITREELDAISALIKDVQFIQSGFTDSIKNATEGDFMYLDPPYAPENSTSFVGYVADGFNLDTHAELFAEIKKLDEIGCNFLMSNAKVELVEEEFTDYMSEDIIARRAINSKKPGSKTTEVLIYN
jgi:DNA adenine methylase